MTVYPVHPTGIQLSCEEARWLRDKLTEELEGETINHLLLIDLTDMPFGVYGAALGVELKK